VSIGSIPAVPTDVLVPVLDVEIARLLGKRVVSVDRRPHPYGTSFPLEELDVTLDDGTRLELVFKDLGLDGLEGSARHAKEPRSHDPNRELEAYRMLDGAGLGTPRLYAAMSEPGRSWLVIERVPGAPLWQFGEREVWTDAAAWVAAMHRHFRSARRRPGSSLLVYDGAAARRALRRAIANASGRSRATLERIAAGFAHIADWFDRAPRTLVHGDFHPSNVLVDGHRITPVDWERAGIGPGLLDLASLTAGGWRQDERAAMVSAYATTAGRPFDDELRTELERCRLVHAIELLGIDTDWRPPPEHQHDWLGEAERAARSLGLR
jgi:aminoglycoside phosphotransferase